MRQRSATGTSRIALVLVLIVMVAAVVGITLAAGPNPKAVRSETSANTSSTATATGPSAETLSSNVSLGLELIATITPTQASPGGNFSVSAQVYNTLSSPVNVTADSMVNPALGPCQQQVATGLYVYSGNYTYLELFNNRSQPATLLLYDPALNYTCPEVFTFDYSFSPQSDMAVVQAIGFKSAALPVNGTSVLSGYWAGSGQNYSYRAFPPGVYTVAVYDSWGEKVIGYFQVTP
jgi:hypothetical protein